MRQREPYDGSSNPVAPSKRPRPARTVPTGDPATVTALYGPARTLALQRTAGNAAVGRLLVRQPTRQNAGGRPARLAVQRSVIIGGEQVDDPIVLLKKSNLADRLSATGKSVLKWAVSDRADLTANDPEGLLAEVDRIAAMINLVQSIVRRGILGRQSLTSEKIVYTGSNDAGNTTKLAVNVLDNRGGGQDVGGLVDESLTAENRGAFSVALERPKGTDKVVDQMRDNLKRPPGPSELSEEELGTIRKDAKGDPDMERLLIKYALEDKRGADTLAANQAVFDKRVQNTLLAIVPMPDKSIANLKPGSGGYEASVPTDKIPPGPGGFTMLVFPQWFEKFAPLMLDGLEWPDGVRIRFVGDRKITANLRVMDRDWPITVDAPDYASEIATQLKEFEYVATHILKTSTA